LSWSNGAQKERNGNGKQMLQIDFDFVGVKYSIIIGQ